MTVTDTYDKTWMVPQQPTSECAERTLNKRCKRKSVRTSFS